MEAQKSGKKCTANRRATRFTTSNSRIPSFSANTMGKVSRTRRFMLTESKISSAPCFSPLFLFADWVLVLKVWRGARWHTIRKRCDQNKPGLVVHNEAERHLLLHEHHQRGELVVAHRRVGSTKHTRRRLGSHDQPDQKAFVQTKHRWSEKLGE